MIKFQATNVLVHSVSPVITIPSKTGGNDFQKRELIIDDSWDRDGKHYSSLVSIDFTGDNMAQLDYLTPGSRANVEGMISGREYNGKVFNSVRGLKATPYQPQPQYAQGAYPQAPGYPQQAPGYPQQAPGYPQQAPGYPQQAPAYPQGAPSSPYGYAPTADNLPPGI